MAFENEPSGGATPPAAAPETTNMLTGETLQAPAATAPAQPPLQLQPTQPTKPAPAPQPVQEDQTPGSFFRKISHSFAGAIVGALAGPSQVVDGYDVDENGKQTPRMRDLRPRDRMARIAQAALEGLAAGSAVGPQKSAGAAWGAGIGAGAANQIGREQQTDLLKRAQAKDQWEQEQQTLTNKYIRAQHNITTYSLWQKGLQDANEHDPERLKTEAIKNSAEDYINRNPGTSMTSQVLSESEARAMAQADKNNPASTTHVFFPYGMREVKENGQTVYEKDGVTPKKEGQVFVIGGGTTDGKMPLPQSFVDDLKKYGAMANIQGIENVKAGDEWKLDRFLNAGSRMNPIKAQEIDGWKESKLGANAVKVGNQYLQENTFTHERRPYGATPQETEKINAQIEKDQSEAFKNRAEGNKANTEANQQKQLNPVGAEGLTGEAYLQTLPQGQRDVIKAIAEGRETRTPRQLQDKNGNPTPLAVALHRAYPDFDDKKAAAYGGLVKDFTTGPTSRTLTSYGTAINHARALYDNTGPNSYIPGTDEYKRYNQDITYVATEVAKALNPTGVATESAIKEQEDALRSLTNRKAAIENAEHILSGKMSEVKQRWADGQVRPSYQPPMPGLSKEALDNAEYIRNQGKYVVTDPNGKPHTFPDQASADKFKKLAGIA